MGVVVQASSLLILRRFFCKQDACTTIGKEKIVWATGPFLQP
jgi:hypothetical protein